MSKHPKIEKVLYPPLFDPKSKLTGFTGMISFYIKTESFDSLCEFNKNLKLFKFGTSLGGIDSLLDHFGWTMRIYYSKE